ncbi:MAG: DUF6029 family protein [Prevotella sp.]|nr:DUF6029 family protein [Prevotella sp.]
MQLINRPLALLLAGLAVTTVNAQENKVAVHGSIQSDILIPQEDHKIGTGTYNDWGLTNTYAEVGLTSKHIEAGVRAEYLEHPLPGFDDPRFNGWGVSNIYVKALGNGFDVTVGDFYDQFGSGFVFRTYEERSLGIDNSIRGARLNVSAVKGANLKLLGGVQRCFWDWDTDAWLGGADLELNMEQYFKGLADKNITWMIGGSYLMKHENEEDVLVPGTNYKLNMDPMVHTFGVRTRLQSGPYSFMAEYAWKTQDPSKDNDYIYRNGSAVMVSASYSKKGLSALVQAKRSENMSNRMKRGFVSYLGGNCRLNHMPAFSYQHTYALPALYPYATQDADGEWAFQGEFGYTFKRRTALGGKYGTKLKVNFSYIRGIDKTPTESLIEGVNSTMGTDGYHSKFFGFGGVYYKDINVQLEKKLSKSFKLNLMYMNQLYNKTVVEGEGGVVKSNIFVAEGKYQFSPKMTLRGEAQYLQTKQDQGDWYYGLLELSVLPYLMFTISDQYNANVPYYTENKQVDDSKGTHSQHYLLGSVTATYKAHRLQLSYGKTRAGYNCSGGVCRFVPASYGMTVSYNYNF